MITDKPSTGYDLKSKTVLNDDRGVIS